MILNITRYKEGDDWTLGDFVLVDDANEEVLKGKTLEPAGPDTVVANQDKRIPEGKYKANWAISSQAGVDIVGKLPLVSNEQVPASRMIRIHIGNTGKDTLGCILLGETARDGFIGNSRATMSKFCNLVYPDDFKITITNKLGGE